MKISRIDVHYYSDLFTKNGHKFVPMDIESGKHTLKEVVEIACRTVGLEVADAAVLVDGRPVRDDAEAWREPVVRERAEIRIAPMPATGVDVVLIAIALLSAVASALLVSNIATAGPSGSTDPEERRFGFNRFSNDAIAGDVIPVVLGRRERFGGKVISKFFVEGEDGDQRVRMLIDLGHGPVNKIGSRTSSWNRKGSSEITGIYFNDQPIANFPGCRTWGRMGTTGQRLIPGFEDIVVPREAGVGGVALVNTSGSERTGSGASGEAFSFTTLDPVDAVSFRVRFQRGLYTLSPNGQVGSRKVKWRYRFRVSAGPGAWSAWVVVTVDRADRSEVITVARADWLGGEGEPAPAAAVYDFEVERVTTDATTGATVDDLLLDTIVETRYASNSYPKKALLAVELKASEQLTTIPRVSVEIEGYRELRIWDGVSDPETPIFDTGYSANPADIALEFITNTVWGLGAEFTDDDVNMAALFEWRTYCDETIARVSGGGTRPRFACDLVIDQRRSGDEWLRTICRTGRCTPQPNGRVWNFIVDRPKNAVEFFGDGDIVRDAGENGGPGKLRMTYRRVSTRPANGAPNQLVAQFENELAGGRNDSMKHPRDGELWLATEITNSRDQKYEGVTDPEQLASQLIYELDKIRGLSRTVKFTTSKPAVVLQAGDRFDLATNMVGWGLASGRLKRGATTTMVMLDRTVVLEPATTYVLDVTRADGTREVRTISSPAGSYAAGEPITVGTAFGAAPGDGSLYALGRTGLQVKPFTCTRVQPLIDDEMGLLWEIDGIEYDANVYNEIPGDVLIPDYADLTGLVTPPGPLLSIRANERIVTEADGGQTRSVELSWTQTPTDRQNTAIFRIYRRELGLTYWVMVPTITASLRGAVTEITDLDRAYQFIGVAVSQGGAALSPDDPRHPIANIVYGLTLPPPSTPGTPTIVPTGGNTYTLQWNDVEGAVGYQVLACGNDGSTLPNGGAEGCLVLARTEISELAGLELPPGRSCTFWVRSVGASGRLSFGAGEATIATPATPVGETIKLTRTFSLGSEGTLTNLTWATGPTPDRLELTNPALVGGGVYLSPVADTSSLTLTELTIRPATANDADDPALNTDPFTVPSISADQWGVVTGGVGGSGEPVVGMLMPPWPDSAQGWTFEVRTSEENVLFTEWEEFPFGSSVRRALRYFQVRMTMKRLHAPYKPGLEGLVVVATH